MIFSLAIGGLGDVCVGIDIIRAFLVISELTLITSTRGEQDQNQEPMQVRMAFVRKGELARPSLL